MSSDPSINDKPHRPVETHSNNSSADIPKPTREFVGVEQPRIARHRRTFGTLCSGITALLGERKLEEIQFSRPQVKETAKGKIEEGASFISRILSFLAVLSLLAVLLHSFQPILLREHLVAQPSAHAKRPNDKGAYPKPLTPKQWPAIRKGGLPENVDFSVPVSELRERRKGSKPIFKRRCKIFSNQQVPKVVKARGTKFMMCTLPKNGCSQWKRLILKVMGAGRSIYLDSKNSDQTIHNPKRYRTLNSYTQTNIDAMLRDKWMPRIALVRNPYARLLSAYQDKLLTDSKRWRFYKHLGLPSVTPTFEDFVKALQRWQRNHPAGLRVQSGLDHHFALQSSMCGFSMDTTTSMTYDYVLKVEETNKWYTPLIHKLNLTQHVASGWPGKRCFFSAPDAECDGQRIDDNGTFSNLSWDRHGTGAAADVLQTYTPETARIVSELYAVDIAAFGYQRLELEQGASVRQHATE